ncbi:ABC transporter permease [Priestia taiwanensis]|uniref:Transport permease protein n=1 Tax=Priestia taiwanensis TaxID=1347902 RepID=A0A917AJ73_9BACI|nr:ABC transporter permease [Priestia taiwanensis]MBM7361819.1 ABC-2 type transport system permease protein [Priestia taiwanensis]GGE57201.1 transport permease protein [Priestia taiwanensis]
MKIKQHVSDTLTLANRIIKHNTRSIDTLITVIAMPIMMLLGIVYIFGGAIKIQGLSQEEYINYILPGILLMTIATSSAYTSLRINIDKSSGMFDRFKSMPISKSSVLGGQVFASVVFMLVSTICVLLVGILAGFRSNATFFEWLLVGIMIILFSFTITWLSVPFGLAAGSMEGAGSFSYILLMMLFVSSAFVPVDGMPKIVRLFAENQPMTPIIQTIRNLFNSQPTGNDLWLSIGWMVLIMIISYIFGIKVYRKV